MMHLSIRGVHLIHKARNLGCFTSSPQATRRSEIDDLGRHLLIDDVTIYIIDDVVNPNLSVS